MLLHIALIIMNIVRNCNVSQKSVWCLIFDVVLSYSKRMPFVCSMQKGRQMACPHFRPVITMATDGPV